MLIIEVNDWHLAHYTAVSRDRWRLVKQNVLIASPLQQVETYKKHLFDLHIDHLPTRMLSDSNRFAVVSCAVYFHHVTQAPLKAFVGYEQHIELLGSDSLTAALWKDVLARWWVSRRARYFDDVLYNSFCRHLQPPYHHLEEGNALQYTTRQFDLSQSRPVQQKIRGVAGPGKTVLLAQRAVNAYLRTQNRVLILTFNITLCNYTRDRISRVRSAFAWDQFLILNHHHNLYSTADNRGSTKQ